MPRPPSPLLLLLTGLVAIAARAEPAHVHGLVTLDLVVEPRSLSLQLVLPQDSLLGHERRPRSAAERQAAAAALQRLHGGAALFGLDAAAGCRPGPAEVEAPQLQAGPAAAPPDGAAPHADVEARYPFDCQRTDGLRSLDLGGLLDAFPRIQRISAQVVTPGGQHKATLQRPVRRLSW